MALHISYRPGSLEEVFGNRTTKEAIRKDFSRPKPPKSSLITGPAGCGKTSFAYIIRDLLGCTQSGFHEFDASKDRGIDKIRKIQEESTLYPMTGDKIVLFFDECHQITGPAQEAMLKLLENPPSHVYLILATTEPQKLKDSIIRRCSQYAVGPLSRPVMIELLEGIAIAENRKWMSKKLLSKIYKVSWGSPGQAVKLLDQVIDMEDEDSAIKVIQNVTYDEAMIIDLCRTLSSKKLTWSDKWQKISDLISSFKGNAESARSAVMTYFEKELLQNPSTEVVTIMSLFTNPFIHQGRPGFTLACWLAIQQFRIAEDRRIEEQRAKIDKNIKRNT